MRRWHWQSLVIVLGIVALSTIIQLSLRVQPLQAQTYARPTMELLFTAGHVRAGFLSPDVYRIVDGSYICYVSRAVESTGISCLKR